LLRESPTLAASCVELPSVSIKGFRDAVQVFEVPWKEDTTSTTEGTPHRQASVGH
jgi:hypothetical protein